MGLLGEVVGGDTGIRDTTLDDNVQILRRGWLLSVGPMRKAGRV